MHRRKKNSMKTSIYWNEHLFTRLFCFIETLSPAILIWYQKCLLPSRLIFITFPVECNHHMLEGGGERSSGGFITLLLPICGHSRSDGYTSLPLSTWPSFYFWRCLSSLGKKKFPLAFLSHRLTVVIEFKWPFIQIRSQRKSYAKTFSNVMSHHGVTISGHSGTLESLWQLMWARRKSVPFFFQQISKPSKDIFITCIECDACFFPEEKYKLVQVSFPMEQEKKLRVGILRNVRFAMVVWTLR